MSESKQSKALEEQVAQLTAERDALHKEYLNACELVAQMHEAAMGEVTGPVRGVVEDVADLRALAIRQEDLLNRILQPGERWLELVEAYRQSDEKTGWLSGYADELDLARMRLQEALRDVLKEMVKR